jgi:hypothetical protein
LVGFRSKEKGHPRTLAAVATGAVLSVPPYEVG